MHYYRKKFWLYVCLGVGFVCGVLFINLCGDTYFREILMWGTDTIQMMQEMKVDKKEFFRYLLELRGKMFLGIWLCGFTFLSRPVACMVFLWIGMSFGILLTSALVQMHMSGILMFFAAILPQFLLYFPALWMVTERSSEKDDVKRQIVQFFNFAVCMIAGVALESNVNPVFLQWITKKIL